MLSAKPQWIAVYTNPRAEKKVDANFKEQGFESYLPLRRELHTWSDRKKWVETPLLKSYTFVRIKENELDTVRHTNGVAWVISFKGNIATIPDFEIQAMKDFLAAEVDIAIRQTEQLKRGVMVRINRGTFEGKIGMLVSDCEEGNFAVEISGISMAMVVHIDQDLMEALPESEQEKPKKKKEYHIR